MTTIFEQKISISETYFLLICVNYTEKIFGAEEYVFTQKYYEIIYHYNKVTAPKESNFVLK